MVLYVIGLGLGDEKDITVRGLEAVRGSTKVVLEHYTSILGVDKAKLVREEKTCGSVLQVITPRRPPTAWCWTRCLCVRQHPQACLRLLQQ